MTYEEFLTELAKYRGHFKLGIEGIGIRLKIDSPYRESFDKHGNCACPALVVLNKGGKHQRYHTKSATMLGEFWPNIIRAADHKDDTPIRQDLLRVLGLS